VTPQRGHLWLFWSPLVKYLREKHPEILRDEQCREHFHHGMFHGYDFDTTMLRIGSMNMMLHGLRNPDIRLSILTGRGSCR